jgi:hypothetical protein
MIKDFLVEHSVFGHSQFIVRHCYTFGHWSLVIGTWSLVLIGCPQREAHIGPDRTA